MQHVSVYTVLNLPIARGPVSRLNSAMGNLEGECEREGIHEEEVTTEASDIPSS